MNTPTDLANAVNKGDAYEVERLLELTSDPDMASAYTDDGWSLLHLAPNREIAALLLSHGADINARNRHKVFGPGNSPLQAAVYMDRPDVVALLIERGADVNQADDAGWAPLHIAVANGRLELARTLLEAGANPNTRIGDAPGHDWANCTPLGLLEVQDRTGEGGPPLPDDVKTDLWRLLREYKATV